MSDQIAKETPQPEQPEEQKKPEEKPSLRPLGDSDLQFSPHIYNYFGLGGTDVYSETVNGRLEKIIEWTGAKDLPSALKVVKETELKLGAPPLGMTRLTQIYNYAKLDLQIKKLQELKSIYSKEEK